MPAKRFTTVARKKIVAEGNLPLFGTVSTWKPPRVGDLPDWSRANVMSIDTEFHDPTLRELGCGARRDPTYLAGISFMLEGDRPYYVPVRHPDDNVENPDMALRYFRDNARKFKGKLLGANIPGDLDVMDTKEGITFDFDQVNVCDIQVIDALIYELHHSYSLENIGKRRNIPGKDKALLIKAAQDYGYDTSKKGWERCIPLLPARLVGPYAEHDASALFPIYKDQLKDIAEHDLHEVIDVETRLTPLLLKIRQRGIRVDFDQLARVEEWSVTEEHKVLEQIKDLTNYNIGFDNCNAADAVAPALLDIGIQLPKTESGQWSITTEILEEIDHPVAKLIRYLRQVNKIRRTFVSSIRRYQTKGRIHGTMRQIIGASEKNEKSGAAFGRLSHVHPNMSQQPSRGEHAPMWRDIYLPEEGQMLCSSDFSAQEPRWVVHWSDLLGLHGASALAEEYRTNPRIDPHAAMAQLIYGDGWSKDDRTNSKIVFLATCYNQGGAKLCKKQLKLPTRWKVSWKIGKEKVFQYFDTQQQAIKFRLGLTYRASILEVAGVKGQEILDQFHSGAPFVKLLSDKATERAEEVGILKILCGRKIHFPMNQRGEWDFTYKALNRLIQGCSGYQTKLAMLALDRECPAFWQQLQIHDELVGSISDVRIAKRVGEIMRSVVKGLRVPFRCEAEVGPRLGSLRVVCNYDGCTNFADKKDKFGCKEHALVAA